MNRANSNFSESFISRPLQPLLDALSSTQRAALTGALALCALLVSGAAMAPAPARVLASSAASTGAQVSASGSAGGDASAGILLADAAGTVSGLPVSMQLPAQPGFLATQMAFLGETGAEIRFGEDPFLPIPDASADDVTALLHETTMLGRLSNQGGFNATGPSTGLVGAMMAAWIGASSGAPGSVNAPRVAGNVAVVQNSGGASAGQAAGHADATAPTTIVQVSGCAAGHSCTTPDLLLAAAPLPTPGPSKDQSNKADSGSSRPDNKPPAASLTEARANDAPAKSSAVLGKDLPAIPDRATLLIASADLPAMTMSETAVPVAVSEPAPIALLAIGVFLLLMLARRRHVQPYA